jgi:hypothetical protein
MRLAGREIDMARFYFHLHECGKTTLDNEGVERDSMDEVQTEACRAAREVMCAEVSEGRLCLGCCIEVQDETGTEVLRVPFREAITISGL